MSTLENGLNQNSQDVFAKPFLQDASLLDGVGTLGIQPMPSVSSPVMMPNPILTNPSSSPTTVAPLAFTPAPVSSVFPTSTLQPTTAATLPLTQAAGLDPLTGSPTALRTVTAASTASPVLPTFSIMAEGTVSVNGNSDFDGLAANPNDDAFIYAGQGFTLNGQTELPVQRDSNGNPLRDNQGRAILRNNAVTVGPNYTTTNVSSSNRYSGLVPPTVVPLQTVDVPAYSTLRQQELDQRIPSGTATAIFNAGQNPVNNAAQWNQRFPVGGTATRPTVVRVTGGGLTIPNNVTISNTIITVDNGDINFNGNGHNLNNVVLITNNGSINLASVQSTDLAIFSSGSINMNNNARFNGKTTIASNGGDVNFNGATTNTAATQQLLVVSQRNITFNGASDTRGTFRTAQTFTFNGNSSLLGSIGAKGNIVFNGRSSVINTTPVDTSAPTITAALERDTARGNTTNTDRLTSDATIVGTVTDNGTIAQFRAGLNTMTPASFVDVLPQRQPDGTFRLTRSQLDQINGVPLADGVHTLKLQATDQAGNTSGIFELTFTLDTTAPSIATPDLIAISDSGSSDQDNITNQTAPIITGQAEAGSTIQLYRGTQLLGETTTDPDGTWQITSIPLAQGTQTITATATDAAGNVSALSDPLTIVVDAEQPLLTLNTATTEPITQATRFTGRIDGTGSAVVEATYFFEGGTAQSITLTADGQFDQAFDLTGVDNGNRILTIVTTDDAGNTRTIQLTVVIAVDSEAPTITATLVRDTAPNGQTNQDRITFDPAIAGNVTDRNAITNFQARFRSTDAWVNLLSQRDAEGRFTLTRSQLELINGAPLPDGAYTLQLLTTDEFGNLREFGLVFVLDTTIAVPTLQLTAASDSGISATDRITRDTTPTLTGTAEPGAQVQVFEGVTLIGQTIATIEGTWELITPPLANGAHQFSAIATDIAGNVSGVSQPLLVIVDAVVPQLVITSPGVTSPLVNDARISGTINGTGSAITALSYRWNNDAEQAIQVDAGSFDQPLTFAGIANGSQTLTITAIDTAGNVTETVLSVVVALDFEAPRTIAQLVRDTAPGNTTNTDGITSDPTITGVLNDVTGVAEFLAGFDAVNLTSNVLPDVAADGRFTLNRTRLEQILGTTLPDGAHTLYLQAKDRFGNVSQLFEVTFVLDTRLDLAVSLDPAFDSAPVGDNATTAASVSLSGQTEAGAIVTLLQTGTIVTADVNGRFALEAVALVPGENVFTVSAEDQAGNVTTTPLVIQRRVTNQAPTDIRLSRDTIGENSAAGTIVGTLSTIDPDVADTHQYLLIDNAEGRFQLVGNELRVAPGAILDYETVTSFNVTVRTIDSGNPTLFFDKTLSVQLSNINERPSFTSTPIINAEAGQPYTYTITTIDPDNEPGTITAVNLPSWLTLTDNGDGTATLAGTPAGSETGIYPIRLSVTDADGLSSVQTYLLGVSVMLREGDRFRTSQSVAFSVDRPMLLSFTIDPTFDTAKTFIKDAFEVALVDRNGRSLVPTMSSDREAFFNWTEGESVTVGAGTLYNETTKTITLNLTGIPRNTEATLVFRLLNDDQDSGTQVRIQDIQLIDAPVGTVPPVIGFGGVTNTIVPATPNFNVLEDVSSSFTVEYNQTSFDAARRLLYTSVAVRNSGTYSVDTPLLVAVTRLSDPSVLLSSPDGYTPEGLPYYDFSYLVADGKLDPSELTSERSLIFYNPNGVQFTYDLVVLAQLNKKPAIESQPNLEVLGGKLYRYEVIATDPNRDTLSYTLLSAPRGMTIDSRTGVITWQTKPELLTQGGDVGNHAVVVRVSDNRGGTVVQSFTVSVLDTVPNRPPIFTTNPVVDAFIQQPYEYDANAVDPDQDNPLRYSLINGPDGMSIDPVTGIVQWTPPPVLVLGDRVVGRLSIPGEQDRYNFSGKIGQRIYLDLIDPPQALFQWTIEIKSPSGKSIYSPSLFQGSVNSASPFITLEENGNYQITVRGYFDAVGTYSFNLIDVDSVPIVRFDTPIRGTLSPGSEEDIYRFTGAKGQKIYFDLDITQGRQFTWKLFKPSIYKASNNEPLQQFNETYPTGFSNAANDLAATLTSDGEYVLVLRGDAGFTQAVPYSFQIVTPDWITTPIDSIHDFIIQGRIQEPGERDFYTFEGTAGQVLFYDTLGANTGITTKIFAPTQELTDANPFYSITTANEDPTTSRAIVLRQSGTYRIEVDGSADTLGDYRFRMLDLTRSTPTLAPIDTADIVGSSAPNRIGAQSYKFTLSEQTYLFVDGLQGMGHWTIYKANGERAQNGTTNSDREFSLDAGDYFLVVRGDGINDTYRLRLTTPQVNPVISSEPLVLGQVISGNLQKKGQTKTYTFNGRAGQALFFDAIAGSNMTIRIFSPQSERLFTPESIGLFNEQFLITNGQLRDYGPNSTGLILPTTGEYRLVIDGNLDHTGEYRFEVLDLTIANTTTLDNLSTTILGSVDIANRGSEAHRLSLTEPKNLFFEGISGRGSWLLYGQTGKFITSASLSGTQSQELAAGDYFLVVQSENSGFPSPNNYNLKIVATPSSLPLNQPLSNSITGTLEHRGQKIVYTFQGTVGEQLFFDSLTQLAVANVRVLDFAGQLIYSGQVHQNQALNSQLAILPYTGTYRIEIEATAPGNYAFRFLPRTNAISATIGSPLPIDFGNTGLNAQAYRFSLSNSQIVRFQGQPQSSSWTLYSSTGKQVVAASLSSSQGVDLSAGDYLWVIQGNGTATTGQAQIDVIGAGSKLAPTGILIGSDVLEGAIQAGQQIRYLLNVSAGQQFFYDALNFSSVGVTLRDPNGDAIYSNVSHTDRGPDSQLTLNTSGFYQVIVQAPISPPGTSSYRFRLTERSQAEVIPFESDSDGRISLNAIFDNNGLGAKTYRFTVTEPQHLSVRGLSSNGEWKLYGLRGELLRQGRDSQFDETNAPLLPGEYFLIVQGRNGAANYSFEVCRVPRNVSSLNFNEIISGNIAIPGQQDTYSFEGRTGQQLFLAGIAGSTPYIKIVDPTGEPVFAGAYLKASALPAVQEFILEMDGVYRLNVNPPNNIVGNYSFQLLQPAPALAFNTSGELTLQETISEPRIRTHVHRFRLDASQHVFIDSLTGTGLWNLFRADGTLVFTSGNGNDGIPLNENREGHLAAGDYLLAVNVTSSMSPAYSLRLHLPELSLKGALQFGAVQTGEIKKPGQQDTYTFEGTPGQQLFFDDILLNRSGFEPDFIIYDPAGGLVGSIPGMTDGGPSDRGLILPMRGIYKLVVDGKQEAVGTYQFRLFNKSEFQTEANEFVPGAPLIDVQNAVEVTGRFDSNGYGAQTYRFRLNQSEFLYFDGIRGSGYWQLYDPSGKALITSTWSNPASVASDRTELAPDHGNNPFDQKPLPAGEYFLIVGGNGGANRDFSFRLSTPERKEFPVLSQPIGETVFEQTFTEAREQHVHRFEGKQGQHLILSSINTTNNGLNSVRVRVYDSAEHKVFEGWTGAGFYDSLILAQNDVYRIFVDSGNTTENTRYQFRFIDRASIPELKLNEVKQSPFDQQGWGVAAYTFKGQRGQSILIDTNALQSNYSWILYGPGGFGPKGSSGINQPFKIFPDPYDPNKRRGDTEEDGEITLPIAGDYTLVLQGGGRTVPYRVQILDIAAQATLQVLPLGEPVVSSVNRPGRSNTYTFTGRAGQQIFLDAILAQPFGNVTLSLYSPLGGLIRQFRQQNGVTNSERAETAINLKDSGEYRLVVDGVDDAVGTWTFTLRDRASATQTPAIQFDSVTSGTLTPERRVHLYQIVGTAGQRVRFDLIANSWTNAGWYLLDPNGEVLNAPLANNPDFTATFASSGVYTLVISAVPSQNSSTYSFRATDVSMPAVSSQGLGSVIQGNVVTGQPRSVTFNATAGTLIWLDSQMASGSVSVSLFNPDGTLVNLPSGSGLFTSISLQDSQRPLLLEQSGEYRIQFSTNFSIAQAYRVQLLEFPQIVQPGSNDYLELNSIQTEPLNPLQTRIYQFDGVAGQTLLLDGFQGQNARLTLFDANGNILFDDRSSGTSSQPIQNKSIASTAAFKDYSIVTLARSSKYYAVVNNTANSSESISFQLVDVDSAKSLKFGVVEAGTPPDGRTQVFKFEAQVGDQIYIDTFGTKLNAWNLFDPDRQKIAQAQWTPFNGSADFSVQITKTGTYYLCFPGATGGYEFRVFRHQPKSPDILIPGDGEAVNNDSKAIARLPIEIAVEDRKGGTATQEYKLQLWADPSNNAPIITSTPEVRFGLNERIYQYRLKAIDADQDALTYRLIDGPIGALLDSETGELLWFPEATVKSGDKVKFQVEVADRRGGKASQEFEVEVFSQLGKLQGMVFNDLNNNGYRDTTIVQGETPDIVFAIDISLSTGGRFLDWTTTDLKTFASSRASYLDMQIASAIAMSEQLIAQGRGNARVGLVFWNGAAGTVDMDPSTAGMQLFTTLNADRDRDGIADLREALNTAGWFGGTYFTAGLTAAKGLLDSIAIPGKPRSEQNLIFLSDGWGVLDGDIVEQIERARINLKAFGVGSNAGMAGLRLIDKNATQILDPQSLIDIFSGWDPRYSPEPFMENVTVYLDLNNNGELDAGEPQQVTRKDTDDYLLDGSPYYYSFDNLLPGTYTVRQLIPDGFKQTAPKPTTVDPDKPAGFTTSFTVTGETAARYMFGLHKLDTTAPNRDPIFLSSPPSQLIRVGKTFTYQPITTDADADPLTYDLPLAPQGMAIDAITGQLFWSPTDKHVGQTNTVILRVRDDKGGIALQTFQLDVAQANQAPVIISAPPTAQPRVNRAFQYQIEAVDPDGDALVYSLVAGQGSGVEFDPATRSLRWTPTVVGTRTFTLQVDDRKGGIARQTATLIAAPASTSNQAPVFLSQPRTTARLGSPYIYKLEVTDPDGDPITYVLDDASRAKGMVLRDGVLSWLPTPAQAGRHSIQLQAWDGRATTTQAFTLDVSSQVTNRAPMITSAPTLTTNLERLYSYELVGQDPDGDALTWSLDPDLMPVGMVIDPGKGALRWQPTDQQIGTHTIAVRLTDAAGLYTVQEFTVTVTGTNTPPRILSTPTTRAAQGQAYRYDVVATDAEPGALTFGLGRRPTGMSINTSTGQITWNPTNGQLGTHTVDVQVIDAQGAIATQTFEVLVTTTAINQAPRIVSTPVFLANLQSPYLYTVQAEDADGDALTYRLIEKPTGMEIDATGRISWTPQQPGTYQVVVAVEDGKMGAAQGFTLTVRGNTAPEIVSRSPQVVALGTTYRYDVRARDAEGDELTYALDTASLAKGITIDERGRIAWTPTAVGQHTVIITVTDALGAVTQEQVQLSVERDEIAPKVQLFASQIFGEPGTQITLYARATDNTQVADLAVQVNGQRVMLDAYGQATVTLGDVGTKLIAIASATDLAGNRGFSEQVILDSLDLTAEFNPVFSLDFSLLPSDRVITAPIDIKGSVGGTGLLNYKLQIAPFGSNEFTTIAEGGNTAITNGKLGVLDPSLLQNDSYTLRLIVTGTNGSSSFVEDTVHIAGELKLGNFRLSFTDLEIPLSGIPITLTRTYDTLTSGTDYEFGHGWRMEFRNTDLRTNLKRTPEDEVLGRYPAFRDGTRVYITLPGGKREGFTFKPTKDRVSAFLRGTASQYDEKYPGTDVNQYDPAIYRPAFEGDRGVTSTLTVRDAALTRFGGRYTGLAQSGYNPANFEYGGIYVLTTKDGIVYEIDAISGKLLTVKEPNGTKLTYTDDAITSTTGARVTFERDPITKRITAVTDPDGKTIRYGYDENGDLRAVIDREENTTRFNYDAQRSHYLREIIDPLGRTGAKTEYDEFGRLKRIVDSNGKPVTMDYNPGNSTQTVRDQLGNATTYEYDDRGNVVTEIDAEGKITKRAYSDDNYILEETTFSDRSDDNPNDNVDIGFTAKYTYDAQGNKLTEETGIVTRVTRNLVTGAITTTQAPSGLQTIYTYGDKSRLLTETDALGRTTTNQYGRVTGNLIETRDATGSVTSYNYGLTPNLLGLTDANNQETRFSYDQRGNVRSVTDAQGAITEYEYDRNGNKTLERRWVTLASGIKQQAVSTWTYDNNNRIKTMTDAENHRTVYGYDELGRQVWTLDARGFVTRSHYNQKGELEATEFSDGTVYRYNAQTDALEVVTAGSLPVRRVQYSYDDAGRKISETDVLGRVTRFVYDRVGRLTETIFFDGDADPNNNPKTITEYYSDGLVKAQIDERGNRTEFRYDSAGRQMEVIYADQTPDTLSDNPRTRYEYDRAGQQTAMTDALNRRTTYVYDQLGRLEKTVFHDQTSTQTEYDKLGRRTAAIDQNGKRTEYRYDELGRLTGVKNALGDWTTYTYNEVGNLMSVTDAESNTTRYEYDRLGRRTAVVLPMLQRSTMTYDAIGNTRTVTDFNGRTIAYDYDAWNWLTQKNFQDGSKVAYTYTLNGQRDTIAFQNASGLITERYDWDYDVRDRLIQRTDTIDGTNRTIGYTYDATGNRTSVTTASSTTTYAFDERNRLDLVQHNGAIAADYTYDAVNNLVSTKLGNGTEEVRQYDALNRLKYLENRKLNATGAVEQVISGFSYTLDKVGNRTQITESNGRILSYVYDDLYRLTQETIDDLGTTDDRSIAYTYDRVGNRQQKRETINGVTMLTEYDYDANDRLLWEKVNGSTTTTYTYDNNGSTTTKTENGSTTEYVWNDDKRLVAATIKDATGTVQQQLRYRYNDEGIRVSSSVNGVETRFLLDEVQAYQQVLEEYAPNGAVQVSYVYGNDLISQTQGGQTTYYHVDGLGSTTELTDATGTVVSRSRYDAYGEKVKSEGAIANKYQFAGEQFDASLGDYYLRERYYDPNVGRFLRQDTYEGRQTEPLTLHKYVYTHNNPINGIDPTGLFTMSEIRAAETISRELERQRATTTVIVLQKFSRHTIEVVKAVARSYVYAQQIAESLARTFRIPMLVIGWEMPSTAEHITRSLLSSGYTKNNPGGSIFGSPQLPPVLSHVREGINDRAWYKKLPVYKNRPAGTSIDEYPYASTAQGGEANYNNNMVSLKAVPVKEQNRQGGIMPNFYRWGMVGDGGMSDMTSWYLNFAHFGSMSYMLDRSGNKRFFSYGV